jgi:hypothetical protein
VCGKKPGSIKLTIFIEKSHLSHLIEEKRKHQTNILKNNQNERDFYLKDLEDAAPSK